jgi:glycosyltransferase involved in cell wall biosynthesis
MKNKILIINTGQDKNSLADDLFKELEALGNSVIFWLGSRLDQASSAPQYNRRIYCGWSLNNSFKIIIFILFSPWFMIFFLAKLFVLKNKLGIKVIICLNSNEKIIFALPAYLLGLKLFWLGNPQVNYYQLPKFQIKLLKFFSRFARLIIFDSTTKRNLLALGFAENRIKQVSPGIKLNNYRNQENIFSTMIKTERENDSRRYFTLGVVSDFSDAKDLEMILRAVKICHGLIPNLQLVVLGDGEAKKQLIWAAKKMEIENIVWFVGQQDNLKKWLSDFAIYLASGESLKPLSIKLVLKAMEAGLPVIGISGRGLSDFVEDGQTGFLCDMCSGEALADKIIFLYKNKLQIYKMGEAGKKAVMEKFDIAKTAGEVAGMLGGCD